MNKETVILDIKNGSFGYRGRKSETVLLRETNLQLRNGELVCLIGRNGSGKSTFLRTVMKLIPLLGGEITMMGIDLRSSHHSTIARTCAFVPTELVNAGEMTVRELVELGRYPYTNWLGKLMPRDLLAVDGAVDAVGLRELTERKVEEISDGEKQRSMIARTLAQKTALMLLDEPSAFLDIPGKYEITSLLRKLCNSGHSVVFSTHDLNLAIRFADKIWLIDHDHIVQGAPEDLILSGIIGRLFDSDRVRFDMNTGDFQPSTGFRGSVVVRKVNAADELLQWTRKALNRNGFDCVDTDGKAGLIITITIENGKNVWILHQEDENLFFHSLYDLTLHLKFFNHELS